MQKGENPQEVLIAPTASVQVYIDEDDVAMFRVSRIEDNQQMWSRPQVVSIGPVAEIVCDNVPEMLGFVVAYTKDDGIAYGRQGKYEGDYVWWSDEIMVLPECNK